MPYSRALPSGPVEAPLWRNLTGADAPVSVADLHRATSAHPNSIEHRLTRWVRAGLITRIEGTPLRYVMNDNAPRSPLPPRVSIDGTVRPRPVATTRERLWRSMRVLRSFDLPALMMAAEAGRRSAEDLINCLCRAGYLRMTSRGQSMRGTWSTYRLVRNTGPRAPSVTKRIVEGRRLRELVDRNTGQRTDISPAAVSLRRSSQPVEDGGGKLTMSGNLTVPLTNAERAAEAWGTDMPAWVALLASAADATSQRIVAEKLGKSNPYVSRILRNSYPGDLAEAERQVRAVFGAEEVVCPLPFGGPIPLKTCIRNRRRRSPANWMHLAHASACPSCPNNTDREED